MANNSISLYPLLTDSLINSMGFQKTLYKFSYDRRGIEKTLGIEEIAGFSNTYSIIDSSHSWNKDFDNLKIHRDFIVSNAQCLYGPKGIACNSAEIGLCVIWMSSDSKQRGVIESSIPIENKGGKQHLTIDFSFATAQLRGEITFKTILYIREEGTPFDEEDFLANIKGFKLGELDEFNINLDGDGSIFPIFEYTKTTPTEPLWHVVCDWQDPTVDKFADSFAININKGHRNYKYLQQTPIMYVEIISQALLILIQKLKETSDWNIIQAGTDMEKGSVANAVYYFTTVLGFDCTNMESLSASIRKTLEKGWD